jgi:hypothetical protein
MDERILIFADRAFSKRCHPVSLNCEASVFRARRFMDLETDLPRQLAGWLVEVNTTRPNRATKEIPAVRLAAEQQRIRKEDSTHNHSWIGGRMSLPADLRYRLLQRRIVIH